MRRPDPRIRAFCEWARNNEPLLAFRSDEEIEKVVRAAWTEKARLLAAIAVLFVLAAVYVTWRITIEQFGQAPNAWQSVTVSMLVGAGVAMIVRFAGDLVVHREISRLARGTYGAAFA